MCHQIQSFRWQPFQIVSLVAEAAHVADFVRQEEPVQPQPRLHRDPLRRPLVAV